MRRTAAGPPGKAILRVIAIASLIVTACGQTGDTGTELPDLPPIDATSFRAHLEASGMPAVVNIWASWCLPCRSEAPLLEEAHTRYGDAIEFIGVDVQDTQGGAKRFLAEFGLGFQHYFDRDRSVPNSYGVIGTPATLFFAPHGELLSVHSGVIDDRTLAINIDDLTRLEN